MALDNITSQDIAGKGVLPLSDIVNLPAEQAKYKFEQILREVVIPKFNAAIDELNSLLYTDEWGNAYLTVNSLLTSYDEIRANTDAQKVTNGIAVKELDDSVRAFVATTNANLAALVARVAELEKEVFVVFRANGGTGTMPQVKRIPTEETNAITLPSTVSYVKEGYTFDGWALSADGEGVYDAGDTVAGVSDLLAGNVLELFATWAEDTP